MTGQSLIAPSGPPPRRDEALAYIVRQIVRSGISPSFAEIGKAMRPMVCKARVQQLVEQLIRLRILEREPAARRAIRIRDFAYCRAMIAAAQAPGGLWQPGAAAVPAAIAPCTIGQLAVMPAFAHLPDVD